MIQTDPLKKKASAQAQYEGSNIACTKLLAVSQELQLFGDPIVQLELEHPLLGSSQREIRSQVPLEERKRPLTQMHEGALEC